MPQTGLPILDACQNQDDTPLQIAQAGYMAYVDTPEGDRLYSVRDWVYHVSDSTNKNLSGPWSDLKKSIRKRSKSSLLNNIQTISVPTPGGYQLSDFADENTLLEIKKYIEAISHDKQSTEVASVHPEVMEALQQHNWEIQHHVYLPSGKIIDIVAHKHEQTLIIECKSNLSGHNLFLAIGQVLCYLAEYGNGAFPAIAIPLIEVNEYAYKMCCLHGILLIKSPFENIF